MLGLKRGTVRLEQYDSTWPKLFEQEKALLQKTFGDRIIAIEHIGSTAIPGLSAKPIIDMNVAVQDPDDISIFIEELPKLGYEYIPERRYADRQFFPKGPPKNRTHHLNLVDIRSETGWGDKIIFRDYLRKNDEARNRYEGLKQELSKKYSENREEYTKRKIEFIEKMVTEAKSSR